VHVSGRVDPVSDIEIIHTELALADLDSVEKAIARTDKNTKSGDKDAIALREICSRFRRNWTRANRHVRWRSTPRDASL